MTLPMSTLVPSCHVAHVAHASQRNMRLPLFRLTRSQMVAHQAATDLKTAPVRRAGQPRAPQCTHIAMTRLYGQHTCMLCGRVPDLEFVYVCEQDHLQEIRKASNTIQTLPVVPDHGDFFETQAALAMSLGMNRSIITQIRAGEYSCEQINILLNQRRLVKEVIQHAERSPSKSLPRSNRSLMSKLAASSRTDNTNNKGHASAKPVTRQSSDQSIHKSPPVLLNETSANVPNDDTSKPAAKKAGMPKCNFKVCHTCRPYFKDRVPTSFEAAFKDEIIPGSSDLPVVNANHVLNLGLRPVTSTADAGNRSNTYIELEAESEELSDDSIPTSSSSDISYDPNYVDPYPCPGILICPLYTPSAGCAYDQGFDDGNKAINHGFVSDANIENTTSVPSIIPEDSACTLSSTVNSLVASPSNTSSISLPDPATEPLTPSKPQFRSQLNFGQLKNKTGLRANVTPRTTSQQGYSLPYNLHGSKSNSSMGSEIEVDGGVALTEQAVETGIPDILNDAELQID